jgi:choline dehydrogenase
MGPSVGFSVRLVTQAWRTDKYTGESAAISTINGGFSGLNGNFLYSINSVPQKNLQNRPTSVLAGNVLGGSSAVNMMMTIRGTTGDYDRWGKFFSANSTWSWDGMLPYFRKALTFVPPNADVAKDTGMRYDTKYWGSGESEVKTSWPAFQYPGTAAQFKSWEGMPGVEFPPDSGAGIPGVYWYPQFMDPKTATRSYAKTGHWESKKARKNYHVITEKRVNKILLEEKKATGVAFVGVGARPGDPVKVKANKEVILSAGAIHSPQVMQLSGLGPKALLTQAGIDTIVDLPGVGQNFQDHPMLNVRWSRKLPE